MDTVFAIVAGAVVSLITAFVGASLALRQFRSERLWERKADAYSKIIESLHAVVEHDSFMVRVEAGENMSEEYKKQLVKESDVAYRELSRHTGIGAYIISNETSKALEELETRQKRLDPEHDSWIEVFQDRGKMHRDALIKIRALAKKDLGIR